ncbi:MAG: DUF4922 domain-containing protein [Bacteroidaceae bacterium]|nr:DUF4922 domain-containing protein [Bacteroidaceae bacterium]
MPQASPFYNTFFNEQLASWPLAQANNEALSQVLSREIPASGTAAFPLRIQHNPSRIRSTAAKVDAASLSERPCFLCACNRPKEQTALPISEGFELLVNPFPILNEHYTIASTRHQPQTFKGCYSAMNEALDKMGDEYMVFYNGPRCGASAPDHLHFQAGRWKGVPLVEYILEHREQFAQGGSWQENCAAPLGFELCVELRQHSDYYARFADDDNHNVVMVRDLVIFIPRRKHRPDCFFADDNNQRLISPGALDMCGLLVAPRPEDYENLTSDEAFGILRECGWQSEPTVHVGIMKAKEIKATQHEGSFTLHNVTIGIGFHWQQDEDQSFSGKLRLVPEGESVWAVNDIALEDYLTSVISSEMNSHAPIEFLKAHAIVSRSWLMAQLERKNITTPTTTQKEEIAESCTRIIRYYDRSSHNLFDVCADDHCQRYQGLARITDAAVEAVKATRGQVLTYKGAIVDARFSKCCGGMSELYETCWDDTPHPEFSAVRDSMEDDKTDFCDTDDKALLATILNDYDTATHNFYSWTERYSVDELSNLVRTKSGIDIGTITALTPLQRGASGRICLLRIEGTRRSLEVGKELEIRRLLSPTHLRSSWFTPTIENGVVTLNGKGWGHGVGMCQIGAAVMASRGYTAKQILAHYYPSTLLQQVYR